MLLRLENIMKSKVLKNITTQQCSVKISIRLCYKIYRLILEHVAPDIFLPFEPRLSHQLQLGCKHPPDALYNPDHHPLTKPPGHVQSARFCHWPNCQRFASVRLICSHAFPRAASRLSLQFDIVFDRGFKNQRMISTSPISINQQDLPSTSGRTPCSIGQITSVNVQSN